MLDIRLLVLVMDANGGSGIVVSSLSNRTLSQKATGGNISFYNGKAIHVFTTTWHLF